VNIAFSGSDESGRYDPATAPMFWDLRVKSLEKQALEPLKALEEMRGTTYPEDEALASVVAKLQPTRVPEPVRRGPSAVNSRSTRKT